MIIITISHDGNTGRKSNIQSHIEECKEVNVITLLFDEMSRSEHRNKFVWRQIGKEAS